MAKETLATGTVVMADFPYDEAGWSRVRPCMILRDLGDRGVVVVYCTTNPAGPLGEKVLRLGTVFDGRVTNLVPTRFALIERRLIGKSERIALPTPGIGREVFSRLAREATMGRYGEAGFAFLKDLPDLIARANAHAAKNPQRRRGRTRR